MGEDAKKKKKHPEPELQKEFEQIEHTPQEHKKEHGTETEQLVKEIEEKDEGREEDEEHHEEKEEEE